MSVRDTIYALSSGAPPAGISVIRISGPDAHGAAKQMCRTLPAPRLAGLRTLRSPLTSEVLDEALVLRFDAPESGTGEDVVEFHCHGGRAVVSGVLGALVGVEGTRLAEPGEFTRRAFENGRIDLTEAEGLADLLEAESDDQRRAALGQADGGLRRQVEQWREMIIGLSAQAELALDYVGEEDAFEVDLRPQMQKLSAEMGIWLARPRMEALKRGQRVVIAGPPNAGKSSLLNALVGYDRAIVSPVAGTTRDHVDVPVLLAGVPITLIDTAGIHQTADEIEAIGVELARRHVDAADIVLWLGDPTAQPKHKNVILVAARADLGGEQLPDILSISSFTGQGLAALTEMIVSKAQEATNTSSLQLLNDRQARHVQRAVNALKSDSNDAAVQADRLLRAREALDEVVGRSGFEETLGALFSRFCLGK